MPKGRLIEKSHTGKRQIYGSQIGRDEESLLFFVSPLDDPDNVDQRRAEVGLRSLKEYVRIGKLPGM